MSKQTTVQELKDEATKLLKTAELIEKMLPDDMPGKIWGTDRNIRITLPFNWSLFQQARRKLGQEWKRLNSFTTDKGDLLITYRQGDAELVITLDFAHDGATCERRQVGVKEVPIYQVVCN
jgi:hypothetical protein